MGLINKIKNGIGILGIISLAALAHPKSWENNYIKFPAIAFAGTAEVVYLLGGYSTGKKRNGYEAPEVNTEGRG